MLPGGRVKQGAIEIGIAGEEVVVEGSNAREVEEGAAAAAEGRVAERVVAWVEMGGGGEIEAGEEGLQGRVAVDEGGEVIGGALDIGAEGEEEGGEEDEGEEVGIEQ